MNRRPSIRRQATQGKVKVARNLLISEDWKYGKSITANPALNLKRGGSLSPGDTHAFT